MVEQLLLALKIGFVVLLYLFVWRVIRVASRDMQAGQESMVLRPVKPVAATPAAPPRPAGRLVVAESPELAPGALLPISHELLVGRDEAADIRLQADGYASARHCRFVRGTDVDVIEDLHSTNGTYVNGDRLTGSRQLAPGDLITIGQTQLLYEKAS